MRIGVNLEKFSHSDRGISVYTRNLLFHFKQIGSDCTFVFMGHFRGVYPQELLWPNAEFYELPGDGKVGPVRTMFIEQILYPLIQKKLQLDVYWHPHNRSQWFTPIGYVTTLHDILPLSMPRLAAGYLDTYMKRILYLSRTNSVRGVQKVIAISNFTRLEILEHVRVKPDVIITVHNGIDRSIFRRHTDPKGFQRLQGLYSLPPRYILTTGSYAPHKNHKVLVDAYRLSNLPKQGVGLVLVGPNNAGGYKRGFRQIVDYVNSLGLNAQIRIMESVPVEDLVILYSNAEIFITTSLYEGFGFTPLEAMACGAPVVASRAGSIPEICGDSALYADPLSPESFAAQLDRVYADRALRKMMIAKGLSQAALFDWELTAQKTLEVIKSAKNK